MPRFPPAHGHAIHLENAEQPTPSWMIDLKLTNHPQHPDRWFSNQARLERRFDCPETDALLIHSNLVRAVEGRLSQVPTPAPCDSHGILWVGDTGIEPVTSAV